MVEILGGWDGTPAKHGMYLIVYPLCALIFMMVDALKHWLGIVDKLLLEPGFKQ